MIMFTCAGTVVMSSSGDAGGVMVVYGTRAPGQAGVVASVDASFCYTSRAGTRQAAEECRISGCVEEGVLASHSGLGQKSFSVTVACCAWRPAIFWSVSPLMILC